MKKIHKLSKILSILVVVTVLGGLTLYTHTARSSALQNMSGFAWGGDWTDQNGNDIQELDPDNIPYEPTGGVGWISFNCTTGGNCGSDDYGVNIEDNGDLVGYAWSSNYGWLKFGGGLAGFPTAPGVSTGNARLNGDKLEGWARFCAGAADPNTCNDTDANELNGGWDGWVSLRGPGYGVDLNPDPGNPGAFILSGFAWGGNDDGRNVVGWINFSTDFSYVKYEPVVEPIVYLEVVSNSVPSGGQVQLSWSGFNLLNSSTGCEATAGSTGWPGDRTSPTGTFNTSPADGEYTYTIRCLGEDGVTWSLPSSVEVTVGVLLILQASNTYAYPDDYDVTLTWFADPIDGELTNCVASNNATGSGDPDWSGPQESPNPQASALVFVVNPSVTFTLDCNSGANTVTASVIVLQEDLPENVEFNYDQVYCSGAPQPCITNLDWELTNAQSCEASTINPPTGTDWGGNIPVPPDIGMQFGVLVLEDDPGEFTTYILDCKMDSGIHIIKEIKLNTGSGASQPPIYQEN